MSGKILLDTNEVLYYLKGDKDIIKLEKKEIFISIITEIELLSYSKITKKEIDIIIEFLSYCNILNIGIKEKEKTISIRKSTKMKLPDCLIIATAIVNNLKLLTEDKQMIKYYNDQLI